MAAGPPTLRDYQSEAIAAVVRARRRGVRRQLVCLPTGAGKTVIFSELARLARRPVLVLAHRAELLEQARNRLADALGDPAAVGIEAADRHAPAGARVVVASMRSLHSERLARLLAARQPGLVIYDEAHHATADDNQRVLRTLGAFDDAWDGTLLGFTATPARADGVGLDQVFDEIVYERGVLSMIADGWLAPLRGCRIATTADLRGLAGGGDDFPVDALAEVVDIEDRNALVARSIQELARDRRTLAFCVTVRHARNLCRALNAIGVPAGLVHGQMRPEDRARVLADFRLGRLQVLTNVGVLTEGFDDPGVSCVAMARPTRSAGLYAQCVGRGSRLAPGKADCLVLDFVDLSDLSLATLPSLAGLPRDLDLQGGDLVEARRDLVALFDRFPGFEVDPGSISLPEIQRRAAAFDPLGVAVDPEVRAVSGNAWHSLGSRGLVLHACWGDAAARKGRVSQVLVLDVGGRPGARRWSVSVDGKDQARFSRLEDAVQAVDHELSQRGRLAASTGRADAAWRRADIPPDLLAALGDRRLANGVATHGAALQALAWDAHGPHRARVAVGKRRA